MIFHLELLHLTDLGGTIRPRFTVTLVLFVACLHNKKFDNEVDDGSASAVFDKQSSVALHRVA